MTHKIHLAIVGASGVVGSKMIEVLEERQFPIEKLYLFASKRSAGKTVTFKGEDIEIQELTEDSLKAPIQIALFSAGGSISEKFAPIAAAEGIYVVDNSSFWRMNPEIDLIVPEINHDQLKHPSQIIANPNCSTIQSVLPLSGLTKYGIKRVVYNTYQAVSGAGQAGINDLVNKTTDNFPYSINDNVIPQIDVFLEDGYTKEENKMIEETRKILGIPNLPITATAVRVPIHTSHAVSINVELEQPFDLDTIRQDLSNVENVVIVDNPSQLEYPLQSKAVNRDEVFVGRIRRDASVENGLNLWVVSDNLRKGAATNTIQIAEELVKNGLV
ncbi:aspartate-semialdehyde dehydrogenase [Fundicoccus culcitae]|uniref:Aspartate-semialdehyde dehydrogenase n=1 Tax=Fundicoccus culcitae TaxID=2969821 RepID=A0ABY5P6P7_9LACT|nr:aspartate-semialdehyde dehydrogenase [Fundicoccus culcitae]UUX34050.1 aspartate-semialdehyde dehydrogenase [Fundicoccus culcitae]